MVGERESVIRAPAKDFQPVSREHRPRFSLAPKNPRPLSLRPRDSPWRRFAARHGPRFRSPVSRRGLSGRQSPSPPRKTSDHVLPEAAQPQFLSFTHAPRTLGATVAARRRRHNVLHPRQPDRGDGRRERVPWDQWRPRRLGRRESWLGGRRQRGRHRCRGGGGRDTVCVSSSVGWVSTAGSDPVPTFDSTGPSAIGRDLTINSGAGSDLISIGTSTVGRNVWLDAGTGNDFVGIDGMQVRRNLFISLGAGNDSLGVTNLRAFAAFFSGGSGTNSLSTDTATRAGSGTLRHYRFRAVANG